MSPRKIVSPVVLALNRRILTNHTRINTQFLSCIIHQRMELTFTLSIRYLCSWSSQLKASLFCVLSTSELGLLKVTKRCFMYIWQCSVTRYKYGWHRNGYYQEAPFATPQRMILPKTLAPQNSSTPKMENVGALCLCCCSPKTLLGTWVRVGFIYTFWSSLLFTSSILKSGF